MPAMDDAVAGNPALTFEFHHQPFSYYSRYGEGMLAPAPPGCDASSSLTDGTIPAISFIKPLGTSTSTPATSTA